ncbi:Histidine kinase [Rhodovastum atsumiense]|uniref:histidine kinase n=1 Tax=Rhodovastum atsumiense TaxID=504468 RepID=A0A5M6INI5_9PROT|nr:PAS domain S-box protein [Rhodovastum atsumiense]KAA5609820.1 PAS domain S-box protein [Rhodovastum atsumiense]CAH2603726.1 Histidine kinase [Rhodovastum atsumiense]
MSRWLMRGAAPSLRARLFQLVAAAMLPLMLLVAGVVSANYRADRERAGQQAQAMARGIALAVEGELRARIAAMGVLAASPHLAAGDLTAFRAQAEAVRAHDDPGANILLLRADGQQVMNLAEPPGAPLPARSDTENLRRVVATGRPTVSDVFIGAVSHRPVIAIDVPVRGADGSIALVLAMNPSLGAFEEAIRRQHLPSGWVSAVLDRKGVLVARMPNPERFLGRSATQDFLRTLFGRDEGVMEAVTLEGIPVLTTWSRPGPSGWGVSVGVPQSQLYAPLWRALGITLALSALALLAALALASLIAARIAGPIHALAGLAAAEGAAGTDTPSFGLREADATAASLLAALRERGEAEAARVQRDAELREAQRVAHIGSWHWDAATDATTGSDELLRIYGLDPAAECMPNFRDQRGWLYPLESWERINEAVQRTLATGIGYELDVEAFRGGTPIWITTRCEAVQDLAGRVTALRGTVQDITRHKRAEDALRESEAASLESRVQLEAALGAMTDAVYISDAAGNLIHLNDAFATFLRFRSKDECARTFDAYPALVEAFLENGEPLPPEQWAVPRALRGETAVGAVCRLRRRDTGETWVGSYNLTPIRDQNGTIVGSVVTARDITEQLRADQALVENEARLRDLLETVNLGTFAMINVEDGVICFWSKGCERLYGWTVAEAVGRAMPELLQTDFPAPRHEAMAVLQRDGEWVDDLRQVTRDGRHLTVAIRAALRRGPDGHPREILVAMTDVTAQRQAEAEIAVLNRHLEERVHAEVAARVNAQARAAHAQHMQALGQIAGGVAHEFNNLLQAVQGGARLIEKRAADPAGVRKFAGVVLKSSERGAVITERLLSFARRSSFRPERIEPAAMLDALRDVLAHTLGGQVATRIELQPVLPAVTADRADLQTALINLATNARDAMPEGGTLTLAATADRVEAETSRPAALRPGRYVRFAVSDEGIGMDAETLARASEPFFTTKPVGSGTGLGLSMAKGFAEQSGGGLAIESAPGCGTTVTLWLPVAEGDGGTAERRRVLRESPAAGRLAARILLVDDEEMVRETLAGGLEDAGLCVLLAQSGAEALALLDAGEPVDVLVTDLSMPGMDGTSLIRHAQERRPDLPAVILTGFVDAAGPTTAGDGPGRPSAVLHKPIAAARLAECLDDLLTADGTGRGSNA